METLKVCKQFLNRILDKLEEDFTEPSVVEANVYTNGIKIDLAKDRVTFMKDEVDVFYYDLDYISKDSQIIFYFNECETEIRHRLTLE